MATSIVVIDSCLGPHVRLRCSNRWNRHACVPTAGEKFSRQDGYIPDIGLTDTSWNHIYTHVNLTYFLSPTTFRDVPHSICYYRPQHSGKSLSIIIINIISLNVKKEPMKQTPVRSAAESRVPHVLTGEQQA